MQRKTIIRILEFLLIGVAMGMGEDLLAIAFATDAEFNWKVVIIVLIVTIPFAIISELIVDHPNFWKRK